MYRYHNYAWLFLSTYLCPIYIYTQAVLTFHSNTHTQTAPLIRVQHISSLTNTLEPSIRVTALLITW